jgi:hypothetical protein
MVNMFLDCNCCQSEQEILRKLNIDCSHEISKIVNGEAVQRLGFKNISYF